MVFGAKSSTRDLSALKETFIKRYIAERTNKAEKRPED